MRIAACLAVLLLAALAQGVPLRSNRREANPIPAPALLESEAQAREAGVVLGGLTVALSVANIVASVSAPYIVKGQKSALLEKYDSQLQDLAIEDGKTAVYIEYLNTFLAAAPQSTGLLEAIAASLRTTETASTAALRTHHEAKTFVDGQAWERFRAQVISKVAPKGLEETGKLVLTAITDPSGVGKTLLDSLTGAAAAASPVQNVAAGLVLTSAQISSTVLDLWRGTEASVFGAQLEQRMIEIRRLYAERTRMFCSLLGEVFGFIKTAFRDNVHFVEGGTKLTQLLYQVQKCGVLYADAHGINPSPDSVGVGPHALAGAIAASPDDEIVNVELIEYADMVAKFPNMGPMGSPVAAKDGAKLAFDMGKLDVARPLSENLAPTNLNPPASASRDGRDTYRGLVFTTRRACKAQLKAAAAPGSSSSKLRALCERGPLVALAVASVSCAFNPAMLSDAASKKMLNVTNYDQMRAFVTGQSPSGLYTPVELVRHNPARIGPNEPLVSGGAINDAHAFPGKRCSVRHPADLNYGLPAPETSSWVSLAGKYIPGLGLLTTPVERAYNWYSPPRGSDPSLPRSFLLAKYAEPYLSGMTTFIEDIRLLHGSTAAPFPGYTKIPVSPKTNDPLGDPRNERTLVDQALQAGFVLEKFVDNVQNIIAPDSNIDTAMRPFVVFKLRPIPITCPFDAAGAASVAGAARGPLSDPKIRFCVGTTDFTLPKPHELLDQIRADLAWWGPLTASQKVTQLPEFASRIARHFVAPNTKRGAGLSSGK